jgi:hypothetical protein
MREAGISRRPRDRRLAGSDREKVPPLIRMEAGGDMDGVSAFEFLGGESDIGGTLGVHARIRENERKNSGGCGTARVAPILTSPPPSLPYSSPSSFFSLLFPTTGDIPQLRRKSLTSGKFEINPSRIVRLLAFIPQPRPGAGRRWATPPCVPAHCPCRKFLSPCQRTSPSPIVKTKGTAGERTVS